MGGSSGGGLSLQDIQQLSAMAKRRLAEAKGDVSRHVFISFSHEDLDAVNLLRGQAKNAKIDLEFDDHSVKKPFDSSDSDYIRRKIREKITRCSVVMVYLSDSAASSTWVNWEIQEGVKQGKGIIGVYTGNSPTRLPPAFREGHFKAVKWQHEVLLQAIENASRNR